MGQVRNADTRTLGLPVACLLEFLCDTMWQASSIRVLTEKQDYVAGETVRYSPPINCWTSSLFHRVQLSLWAELQQL